MSSSSSVSEGTDTDRGRDRLPRSKLHNLQSVSEANVVPEYQDSPTECLSIHPIHCPCHAPPHQGISHSPEWKHADRESAKRAVAPQTGRGNECGPESGNDCSRGFHQSTFTGTSFLAPAMARMPLRTCICRTRAATGVKGRAGNQNHVQTGISNTGRSGSIRAAYLRTI